MKRDRYLVLGAFLFGVVLANLADKELLTTYGILNTYFLEQYAYSSIRPERLFWQVLSTVCGGAGVFDARKADARETVAVSDGVFFGGCLWVFDSGSRHKSRRKRSPYHAVRRISAMAVLCGSHFYICRREATLGGISGALWAFWR